MSRTSLRKDRVRKARVYATAGVPEYWIVDLVRACVIVHTDPRDGTYTRVEDISATGVVAAIALPLPPLPVADLFADD